MYIEGIDNIFYIKEFELIKRCGEHSRCYFKASIPEKDENKYMNKIDKPVIIHDGEDKNGTVVFYGLIQEINVEKTYSSTALEVFLTSASIKIDREPQSRIFQDLKKTYGKILSAASMPTLKTSGCSLDLDGKLNGKPYKNVLVQNEETDFAFIKRMAQYGDIDVWVMDTREKPVILLKQAASSMERSLKDEDIIGYKIKNSSSDRGLWIKTKKYLELGHIVKAKGRSCIVTAVNIKMAKSVYEYEYELSEKKQQKKDDKKDKKINPEKTIKLKAKVENVKDPDNKGRIQVSFIDIEDKDKSPAARAWLPYRSPYSGKAGGIVFIPDKGDLVEVIYTNGQCYVDSTLRDNALDDECRKVEEKYIGNNTKQRIFWKEKSLELFSFDNKIVMDENKIEMTVGDNKILLDKEQIVLKRGDDQIMLSKSGIVINTKGDADIKADKEIKQKSGKAFRAEAGGDIEVKGSGATKVKTGGTLNLTGSKVNIC